MGQRTVLITGAAGGIGRALWPALTDEFQVRLLDVTPVPDAGNVECITADITDHAAITDALQGVHAVVHLAANRFPTAPWDQLIGPNVVGQHTVLSAAAEVGVPRVVLASSCHASGRYDVDRIEHVDPTWPPRPCCPYGVTKVFGESAGRLLSETAGLQVIALRFGAVQQRPYGRLDSQFWLSLDDMRRIVIGALHTDVPYGVYWAGSRNVIARWNLEPSERDLGFVPLDDSADFRDDIDESIPVLPCYEGSV
jgi:nucleoside-diphosphate-sugar epimerase